MTRAGYLGVSVAVTLAATAGIMLLGGYYDSPARLPAQLALIAVPIALPLILASLAVRGRAAVWLLAALILAAGWGYVGYVDARLASGGDASLAMVVGWMASSIAACIAAGWALFACVHANGHDHRSRTPFKRK